MEHKLPTHSDDPLHENPWFRVHLRNGYYTLEPRQPQVAVVPTLGMDLVMVKVFRPVVNLALLEFPAGGAENGESPVAAARREMAEETGIHIEALERFIPMPSLSICPDRVPSWPHLFRVELEEAEFLARGSSDGEVQEVCRLTLPQALAASRETGDMSCLAMALLLRHTLHAFPLLEAFHE